MSKDKIFNVIAALIFTLLLMGFDFLVCYFINFILKEPMEETYKLFYRVLAIDGIIYTFRYYYKVAEDLEQNE